MKQDEGAKIIAGIWNRLSLKEKESTPRHVWDKMSPYMVEHGYHLVGYRWYPNTTEGEPTVGKIQTLTCCCCGAETKGRQWHNRDKGYGVCNSCADWMKPRENAEHMHLCYGTEGVHYNVQI